MEISTRKEKGGIVVALQGRLDAVTSPELEKQLTDLIAQGETIFVINFAGLDYISSAGLRCLLAVSKKLKEKGGTILMTTLQKTVNDVFRISGFHTIFRLFDSEEDALAEI